MTSTTKHTKKQQKVLQTSASSSPEQHPLTAQLKLIIKSLNQFLKKYFDQSLANHQAYVDLVKQYFIEQSTNSQYSCLLSSMFSKISNMLQPFLQKKYQSVINRTFIQNQQQYCRMKQETSTMRHKIQKQERKIKQLKQDLNKYKQISGKLTNFVYMLRINNIDVDTLYEKGCELPSKKQFNNVDKDIQISQYCTQYLKKNQPQNFETR